MKKFTVILVLLSLSIILCACSTAKYPTEGIWYCEELKVSINFGKMESEATPNCAKLYSDDGTYTDILCYMDYGTGLHLTKKDDESQHLFCANYTFNGNVLMATRKSDGHVFTFIKIEDEADLVLPSQQTLP